MSDARELLQLAREAHRNGRDLDARLALAAGVTQLSGDSVRPIVVGGTAVDFYAAHSTPTGLRPSKDLRPSLDLDVVTVGEFGPDAARLRRILAASPEFYSQQSAVPVDGRRKWWLKGAPLLLEVLGGQLFGDPHRVFELRVQGAPLYLWGPEDTAWQSMQSSLATRDRASWERAVAIAAAQAGPDWDWDYLSSRAEALAPRVLIDALRDGDDYDAMLERVASA